MMSTVSSVSSKVVLMDGESLDNVEFSDEVLDQDLYGFTLKCFFRELYAITIEYESAETSSRFWRIGRILSAFLLLYFNIFLQVFVMVRAREFVVAKRVVSIRMVYEQFERHMYAENVTSIGGHLRGKDGFFQAELFHSMDGEVKEFACNIPISQPDFLFAILFVWSLTCAAELRRCLEYLHHLICKARDLEDGFDFVLLTQTVGDESGSISVRGLNLTGKVMVCVLILLPRMVITVWLAILGFHWLTATNDFENLFLNSVALEFVMMLKNLLYYTMVSAADKREVELTCIELPRRHRRHHTSCGMTIQYLVWGSGCALLIVLYICHLQTVLPDYKWDVRDVCKEWLNRHFIAADKGV
mmetsp:Transcript_62237/g.178574  ORF Transcript_62237/g.178574 Transcript_62237/m.178574 type:complete len:358 (+) Transcript_62237:1-1074(+)